MVRHVTILRHRPARHLGEAGLTTVEVLIAALLFLVIMLGTLPLFTRALTSNASGGQSTTIGTDVKDQLERYYQAAFDDPLLAPGLSEEVRTMENDEWIDKAAQPPDETTRATRATSVRQYHFSALTDGDSPGELKKEEALDGDANAFWISLKEIEVAVQGTAEGALAPSQSVTQRVYKSQ